MDLFKSLIAPFSVYDSTAIMLFGLGWLMVSLLVDHARPGRESAHTLMREYRRNWMRQLVTRPGRILDSAILATLSQSTSFFASACMIAIGGCFALLGQADHLADLAGVIGDGPVPPKLVWEVKIFLVLMVVAYAFLKFVWAVRLFGFCAVVMASVPEGEPSEEGYRIADRAADLNIYAARQFNRGLRAVYFALAALFWLIGPVPMMLATGATCIMLYRREFHSDSRATLLGASEPEKPAGQDGQS
ncbi:MAG: DUF599 domain-containing protein [Alphaproteobacteria bacterium]